VAATLLAGCPILCGQHQVAQRPKITGISHVAYYVSDMPKAIAFWHDLLGFEEYYELNGPDATSNLRTVFIKINDHQHVELSNATPPISLNMMSHLCFTVDNVEQMRAYLRAQGIEVPTGSMKKTQTGDIAFTVQDPDGTRIEFMQSSPDGVEAKAAGKFMPQTRISEHIYHVGFLVGNSQRAMDFYGRVLGFKEIWRGASGPNVLSWINMQVPDGSDYVEFMLYGAIPPVERWGTSNHIALELPDMAKAVALLENRPAYKDYGRELKINIGRNGKRQVNIYDPDGTRVELMEPHTVDGKPVAPSTAPPPTPMPIAKQ